MPTILTLFKNVLRMITPEEVDANFEAIVENLDKLGGYTASQTPGANQIPVIKADGSTVLPGDLAVDGATQSISPATKGVFGANGGAVQFRNDTDIPQTYCSSNVQGFPWSPTRKVAAPAAQISLDGYYGVIRFNQATAGAAGAAFTWTQSMVLDATGALLIGTTGNNGSGAKLQVNGGMSAARLELTQTTAASQQRLVGNANAQGPAQVLRFMRQLPAVSLGTKIIIPFVNQGSLNMTTFVRLMGIGSQYNVSTSKGFSVDFSVGNTAAGTLTGLIAWNGGGAFSSIAINGNQVEIILSQAYTSATASGVNISMEYMTPVESISIDLANVRMN